MKNSCRGFIFTAHRWKQPSCLLLSDSSSALEERRRRKGEKNKTRRKSVPWPPHFSGSRKRKRRKEKQRQPWTCGSQSTPEFGDPRRAQYQLQGQGAHSTSVRKRGGARQPQLNFPCLLFVTLQKGTVFDNRVKVV